jgi:hypothetical protein
MEFAQELLSYMRVRRKLWLLPVFTIFLVFGALMLATQGTVIAPFIYTLF